MLHDSSMWDEGDGSEKAEVWKAINNFPPTSTPPPLIKQQIDDRFTALCTEDVGMRVEGGKQEAVEGQLWAMM